MTRRDFFSSLVPSRRSTSSLSPATPTARDTSAAIPGERHVAVIAGRHCLAYRGSFCSTCVERCPVPGAITTQRGLPRVNPDLCTGCRICHDLCPAPINAIPMLVMQAQALPIRTRASSLPIQPQAGSPRPPAHV